MTQFDRLTLYHKLTLWCLSLSATLSMMSCYTAVEGEPECFNLDALELSSSSISERLKELLSSPPHCVSASDEVSQDDQDQLCREFFIDKVGVYDRYRELPSIDFIYFKAVTLNYGLCEFGCDGEACGCRTTIDCSAQSGEVCVSGRDMPAHLLDELCDGSERCTRCVDPALY